MKRITILDFPELLNNPNAGSIIYFLTRKNIRRIIPRDQNFRRYGAPDLVKKITDEIVRRVDPNNTITQIRTAYPEYARELRNLGSRNADDLALYFNAIARGNLLDTLHRKVDYILSVPLGRAQILDDTSRRFATLYDRFMPKRLSPYEFLSPGLHPSKKTKRIQHYTSKVRDAIDKEIINNEEFLSSLSRSRDFSEAEYILKNRLHLLGKEKMYPIVPVYKGQIIPEYRLSDIPESQLKRYIDNIELWKKNMYSKITTAMNVNKKIENKIIQELDSLRRGKNVIGELIPQHVYQNSRIRNNQVLPQQRNITQDSTSTSPWLKRNITQDSTSTSPWLIGAGLAGLSGIVGLVGYNMIKNKKEKK